MTTAAKIDPHTHETYSPIDFRERVHALVGGTTYREPVGGHSTSGGKRIPTPQMVAATLACARQGANDIGPDIAMDIATGSTGHYAKVCEWMGRELARDRGANVARSKAHLGLIAVVGYRCLVLGEQAPPAPLGCRTSDWGELVIYVIVRLQNEAENALACARRKWRGGA